MEVLEWARSEIMRSASVALDSQLRERLKSCNDAQQLHGMIANWQSSAASQA